MDCILHAGSTDDSRLGLLQALRQKGHEVRVARTTCALVQLHRCEPADLIVIKCATTDDLMRIIGFRCEELSTPIVALLDRSARHLRRLALLAGANQVLEPEEVRRAPNRAVRGIGGGMSEREVWEVALDLVDGVGPGAKGYAGAQAIGFLKRERSGEATDWLSILARIEELERASACAMEIRH